MEMLDKLEAVETGEADKPVEEIKIVDCGVYED